MHYIIGVGGVGSWLAPALCPLVGPKNVTLIDGDKLEKKNLNRQLFDESDIGSNKAEALAEKYGCGFIDKWYTDSLIGHETTDWLFCLVDNNPARRSIFFAADRNDCRVILAANETHSSEALFYMPKWRDHPRLDPRVSNPEINTDASADPRAAAIGCTGEAQKAKPQLVTANMMAASMAAHLYVFWGMEARKLGSEMKEVFHRLPYKLVNNLTGNETHRIGEI